MLRNSLQDLRYAFRQLRKSPGFTATALLTLAFGLGGASAVYTVIHEVLLSPLPYFEADRLVGIGFTYPQARPNAEQAGSSADFIRANAQAFSSTAILDDSSSAVNLSVSGGRAVQIQSLRVSEPYFRTLGVMPELGRGILPEEDIPGGAKAAVLSHALWAHTFGSDPAIVGRAIRINQETFTVVGVMPASFTFASESAPGVMGAPEVWVPLQLSAKDPGYDGDNYTMIGRLRAGVTLDQAQRQLDALAGPFYRQYPSYKTWLSRARELHEFRVWKLQDVVVSDVRQSLMIVMGAVLAVLLIACLNLAGLMTARSMRRSREFAVRSALGASRANLSGLLMAEGVLLAFFGGTLALVVSRAFSHALMVATPLGIPNLHGTGSPWLTAAVVFCFAFAAACVFSLLPAWAVLRKRSSDLRLGAEGVGQAPSNSRLSRALLIGQVALAMVLLSTASTLLGTFLKLRSLPSGVQPKSLAVFQVALKGDRYAKTDQTMRFVTGVLEQLRQTPGVDRVAAINGLPLDRGLNMGGFPVGHPDSRQIIEMRTVTPGYFQTMGVPLLAGRDLADEDRAGAEPVIVIGESAAKKFWPHQSPIGESFRIGNEVNWRIVGVAADVRTHSLVETGDVVIYAPMAQLSNEFTGIVNNWFPTSFAVRTAANVNLAAAAQQAVERADPEIPIARLSSMQAVIDSTIEAPQFYSVLAASFSAFALLLTIVGLFGLLSYQVTQRTREIGVRMALGADRARILTSFLMHGMMLSLAGGAIGLVGTWFTGPVIRRLLADSGLGGPGGAAIVLDGLRSSAFAAFALSIAALIACVLPARRAAAVEPMRALRAE